MSWWRMWNCPQPGFREGGVKDELSLKVERIFLSNYLRKKY